MSTAEEYRARAKALYQRAKSNPDRTEALVQVLQAVDFESMAEELERGQVGRQVEQQVQQHGTQPPPPAPMSHDQPGQQQQQVQPEREDE